MINIPTTNLKLYYHLDGNSTDSSAGGHNGTDSNIVYSGSSGKFGQGAGFNGTSSKIVVGSHADVNPAVFTIMAWVRHTIDGVNRSFYAGNAATGCIGIGFKTNGKLALDKSGVVAILTSTTAVTSNVWAHIAITYDAAGVATAYLNGSPNGTATSAQTFTAREMAIGLENGSNWYYGALDEFALYNGTAMTAAQIKEIYNNYISEPSFLLNLAGNFKNN